MPEPTMHCRLCPEVTPIDAIVDHVRLMHPDVYEATPVMFVEQRVLHRFRWRTR